MWNRNVSPNGYMAGQNGNPMTISIICLLLTLAGGICCNGILGMCGKVRHDYFAGLGLFCLVSGVGLVGLDLLSSPMYYVSYNLLAILFLLSSCCNILAAQIQRISILCGFDTASLRLIADEWRTARKEGDYHAFLAGMKNSEYLRYISDALRIVHSIAVSLPKDHTFRVTDYGYLVNAYSLEDQSRYTVLVAYPNIGKDKLEGLSLTVFGESEGDIYVVSDKYGIKVPELLDHLSNRLLKENLNNITIKYN